MSCLSETLLGASVVKKPSTVAPKIQLATAHTRRVLKTRRGKNPDCAACFLFIDKATGALVVLDVLAELVQVLELAWLQV